METQRVSDVSRPGLIQSVLQGVARITTIAIVALAAGGAPATEAQAAAAIVVNDGGDDCGGLTAGYGGMQAAVDAAIASGVKTIMVCPGGYFPFVVDGANKLTIKAAKASLPMPVIGPMVQSQGTIIHVRNSKSVTISGLRVDGTNFDDILTGVAIGILYTNSTGTVQDNFVTAFCNFPSNREGAGYGIAVMDTNPTDAVKTSVVIKNNKLTEIAANRIEVQGAAKATVTGNDIQGPAGMYAGFSSGISFIRSGNAQPSGSISNNRINHVSTGIGLYNASKITVKGNIVTGASYGVIIYSRCDNGGQADGNTITGNHIQAFTGVQLHSLGGGCGSHADKNTISKNTFTAVRNPDIGIVFSVSSGPNTALMNKITGNKLYGYRVVFNESTAPTTIAKGNQLLPLP